MPKPCHYHADIAGELGNLRRHLTILGWSGSPDYLLESHVRLPCRRAGSSGAEACGSALGLGAAGMPVADLLGSGGTSFCSHSRRSLQRGESSLLYWSHLRLGVALKRNKRAGDTAAQIDEQLKSNYTSEPCLHKSHALAPQCDQSLHPYGQRCPASLPIILTLDLPWKVAAQQWITFLPIPTRLHVLIKALPIPFMHSQAAGRCPPSLTITLTLDLPWKVAVQQCTTFLPVPTRLHVLIKALPIPFMRSQAAGLHHLPPRYNGFAAEK